MEVPIRDGGLENREDKFSLPHLFQKGVNTSKIQIRTKEVLE